MRTVLASARTHWRYFIWAWGFPFFVVFVYVPVEKALPEYRGSLWVFLALPVFFACYLWAWQPVRLKQSPFWTGALLVCVAPVLLSLVAVALRDVARLLVG